MRRALRYLWFLMLVVVVVCEGAEGTRRVEITILHTNDLHQSLAPLARIAGYVRDYKRQHPNTLFLDAGDFFERGSSLVTRTRGEAICAAMARMGYDGLTLGNHEWYYGGARLAGLIRLYRLPVLCANLEAGTVEVPENVLKTRLFQMEGVRVGVFGLSGGTVRRRPDLRNTDIVKAAQEAIKALKAQRADVVVALTHLGIPDNPNPALPGDKQLCRRFPEIDVVVGGHSHDLVTGEDARRLFQETGAIIVQSGGYGAYVGKLVLDVDGQTGRVVGFDVENVKVGERLPVDEGVASLVGDFYRRYMPEAGLPAAQVEEPLEPYQLGFWYAEFIRSQVGADVALLFVPHLWRVDRACVLNFESLYGRLQRRLIFTATVSGDTLEKCLTSERNAYRLNPLYKAQHKVIFYAGMRLGYDAEAGAVMTDLDAQRQYRVAFCWPVDNPFTVAWRDVVKYLEGSAPVQQAVQEGLFLGMAVREPALFPATSWQLMRKAAAHRPLMLRPVGPDSLAEWKLWLEDVD